MAGPVFAVSECMPPRASCGPPVSALDFEEPSLLCSIASARLPDGTLSFL